MEQPLQNGQYPQDVFLKKWSWGGFLITPIWALASRLYVPGVLLFVFAFAPQIFLMLPFLRRLFLFLLVLQPIFLLVLLGFGIYFGLKGRQQSWTQGKWESFDLFRKRQKFLDNIGFIIFLVGIVLSVISS